MKLTDYFNDQSEIIQEIAKNLYNYSNQLQNGDISKDEYDNLCDDATVLDDVIKIGKTIEELELLDKTIEILKSIASAIPIP